MDINETAIKALERENSCGGMEVVIVLKCNRDKINSLYTNFSPEGELDK